MSSEMDLTKKMDFGKNLDWTFDFFGKNFVFLLKVVSCFFIPGVICFVIIQFFTYNYSMELFTNYWTSVSNMQNASPDETSTMAFSMFGNVAKMYAVSFLTFLLYGIFMTASSAASVRAVGNIIEKREESIGEIAKVTSKKLIPLLFTSFLALLMLIPAFLCCIIPGLILMIYLTFIIQAIMLENKFVNAIGRSFSLVRKNFWIIVLILLVLMFLYFFIAFIFMIPVIIIPYIKLIKNMIHAQGVTDPSMMVDFMKDFSKYIIIITGISIIISIFYIIINNIAITLKFYNIKNLREGSAILDKLEKTAEAPNA